MIELINRASDFANRTAIISNQTTFTYQQLLNASSAIATHLLDGTKDLKETRKSQNY